MDPWEGQGRAIIAAALIVRGAVEVPAIPTGTERVPGAGGMRIFFSCRDPHRAVSGHSSR
jgi:hypothetical protein